jgi:hypothetical protein
VNVDLQIRLFLMLTLIIPVLSLLVHRINDEEGL